MHFLAEYGMFLIKAITIVAAILIILASFFGLLAAGKKKDHGKVKIKHLNKRFNAQRHNLQETILDKKAFKAWRKQQAKAQKKSQTTKPRVFMLEFTGDVRAQAVSSLREEVSAILAIANEHDQIVLKLESPGGMVHAYGLAASQLQRIKAHGLHLTVCVDKVAASGGYLMACIADNIIAAPFAIIGSIGVIAQLPNFHRWLDKHEIDVEQISAGDYKRTLTLFGENTPEKREKFTSQVQDTHDLFKQFVEQHRPQVNIEEVATGEYWYGSQAFTHRLIDALGTSDDYLLKAYERADIFSVRYKVKKSLSARLWQSAKLSAQRLRDLPQQQRLDTYL